MFGKSVRREVLIVCSCVLDSIIFVIAWTETNCRFLDDDDDDDASSSCQRGVRVGKKKTNSFVRSAFAHARITAKFEIEARCKMPSKPLSLFLSSSNDDDDLKAAAKESEKE
jgi:hypothetical protein